MQSFERLGAHNTERSQSEQLQFSELLKSFDFDTLDKLINDRAREVGYTDITLQSLRADTFYELTSDKKGDYDPESKRIGIGIRKVEQDAAQSGIDATKLAAHGIIHEEMHAVSGQHHIIEYRPFKLSVQVGFDQREQTKPRMFWLWNEGVTEKLAREIYWKYASAKDSATAEDIKTYMEKIEEYGRSANEFYQPEVDLVNAFIERMAKEIGDSPTLVWNSIVHGLLRGERWSAGEIEEWTRDILPPNFMGDLERFSTHSTATRLARELSRETVQGTFKTSKVARKITRAIEAYSESLKKISQK